MKQELYRPDVPESPPAYYTRELTQPTDVTLTREAKARALKKAKRIARPLAFAAIGALFFGHSPAGFLGAAVLAIIVEIVAWFYLLRVERKAEARGLVLQRSQDEE